MHPHPLDPPAPYRAAFPLARLIAAGLLDYPECLAALTHAGNALETPSGLRTRLAHALTDAVAHWTIRRAHATRAIRRALAPRLADRAPDARLLDAARAENRQFGHPLRDIELLALARDEAAHHLARAQHFEHA